jgi:uroporphyrinogen-III synthase
MRPIIIVRPEPGASQTANRARDMGLSPVIHPLFALSPIPWAAPDPAEFDGLMLTSANAVYHGGDGLRLLRSLPVLAVGLATAQAAEAAGFSVAIAGEGSAQDLAGEAYAAGFRNLLRLIGASPAPANMPTGSIMCHQVYTAAALSPAIAPEHPAIALLHSAKAAARFSAIFAGDRAVTDVIAISAKVAQSAGRGWRSVSIAARPDDSALLALACNLCEQDAS